MNKINILHLRASNFYGGPERQLHFHCRKSLDSEFNITVGSFSEANKEPEFLKVIAQDDIRTHTFFIKGAYDPKAITLLKDFLKINRIDILCTHDYRTHFIAWFASRTTAVGWIAFSRGWTSENIKIKLYSILDKIIIRFARHIVAVSHSQKRKLEKVLIPSAKISVVHNAIDPSAFENIPAINLRERYNLKDNSIIGISGGRFSYEKGQIDLVKAAKMAIKENSNLVFILFGNGPDLEKIKNKILKENLSDHVFCPGFEKDLLGCIKGADFLINPSLSEGLPNIILEAMALKVPCLATDVGGVGEIIENNHNGLLVHPKSPGRLADAILMIAGNTNLSERFINNFSDILVDKFSFDDQFEKLRTVYTNLMEK